jgi:PadR family transcriptional regulator AphA
MSLEHAILGFLDYGPKSGYDLKKVFDVSVQHFWPADQGQIYRTLARLVDHGWAEMEHVEQKEHPDRKVYHITASGREELQRWLTTPLPPKAFREPELIQVFFAGRLEDGEVLAMFERMAEKLRQLLAGYEHIPGQTAPARDVGMARENFFWMLTLERGVHAARADLDWVESVIRRVRNREHPAR